MSSAQPASAASAAAEASAGDPRFAQLLFGAYQWLETNGSSLLADMDYLAQNTRPGGQQPTDKLYRPGRAEAVVAVLAVVLVVLVAEARLLLRGGRLRLCLPLLQLLAARARGCEAGCGVRASAHKGAPLHR